jgi:drug/metabolite transporter (DMT)-like permease
MPQGSKENWLTYATLIPVMGGIAIASGAELDFHMVGFLLATGATAGRALKSVVQSMLMTDPGEKLDPMSLLFYMSAVSVALLTGMTLVLEPDALTQAAQLFAADNMFAVYMLINAALAYATNLLNFLVTKYTSALTLQVLGNAKGVVAAAVSVRVFGNTVTTQGILGYAITVAGVFAYSESKRRAKAEKEAATAKPGDVKEGAEWLLGGDDQGRSPFRVITHHPAQA